MIYISNEQAEEMHRETVRLSGGGSYDILHIGYLYSVLEHIQNDDYYPTFEDKLTHLIWSINKNHSFADGNKRLSITLGAQFLLFNGYLYCLERFLREMENISYHLAASHIDKKLLQRFIHSFLENEIDFDEELKLEYFLSCADETIGFEESNTP
jgi:death-on-curing protein